MTGPGWYPDPSGMPDKFRWWDGHEWTRALADDADAPAPVFAPPVRAPGQPPAGGAPPPPAGQPPTPPPVVPPPPDRAPPASEPEEDEPVGDIGLVTQLMGPRRSPDDAAHMPAPQPWDLDSGDEASERRTTFIAIGVVLLLTLVLAAGGWLTMRYVQGPLSDEQLGGGPAPGTTEEPTPEPTAEPTPEPTPEPTEEPTPEPTEEPVEDPPAGAQIEFESPAPDTGWETGEFEATIPAGRGVVRVTEESYDGENDWVAVMLSGYAPDEEVPPDDDLATHADALAEWFAGGNFPEGVEIADVDSQEITVEDRPAYLLRKQMSYEIDGLEATSDLVSVIVVDLGPENSHGVMIASIPDTDLDLGTDVEAAVNSLTITTG